MRKIVILLSLLCIISLVSCSSKTAAPETSPETSPETTDGRVVFLDSQAVSIARNSSVVQNKIASYFGLKFFYAPDWGSYEVWYQGDEFGLDANYRVDLKGTISGYTDDYKTIYKHNQKFNVRVWVNCTGEISPINITVERAY